MSWRCFHCDESFDDADSAAAHFGTREWHNPACKIDAAEYRRMEAREASYAEEDAEIHRMMRRMESLHQQSLRRAEEAGYAKGLQAYTELQAKLDAVTRDAIEKLQQAADSLRPPERLTELRAEYWKAGAVAAIEAMNAALTGVAIGESHE